jgi:hypothetical protein
MVESKLLGMLALTLSFIRSFADPTTRAAGCQQKRNDFDSVPRTDALSETGQYSDIADLNGGVNVSKSSGGVCR